MKMRNIALLGFSHLCVGLFGFAAGIYVLPILIAPPGASDAEIALVSADAQFTTVFRRDLKGSDAFHWGEGDLSISNRQIALKGSISPGPDFRLYLSPTFVETEPEFEAAKASMAQIAMVNTFDNFVVSVPSDVNLSDYNTVVIWCERFGEFITAGQYR